jgi:DNA primase
MDVLMAHQHGLNNVVAQMGTALTEAQLRRLKRYTQRFILALDSDVAGDQATLRGLDVARQVMDRDVVPVPTARGLIRFEDRLAADIRIVSLPAGRDPDEVIHDSPARWAQLIATAKPIMDYYFQALTADLDLATANGKREAVRRLGPLVAELGDRVQRTHYLQQLARMVQVDERTLWQQIRQTAGTRRLARPTRSEPSVQEPDKAPLGLDGHCLSFALCYPELLPQADATLRACEEEPFRLEDLTRPDDRAILAGWRQWLMDGGSPEIRGDFYDMLGENLQQRVNTLLQAQQDQPPAPEDLLRSQILDAMSRLRLENLRRRIQEIKFLLEDAQAGGDREAFRRHGELNIELNARIRRLQKSIGERSISGRRQREDAAVRAPFAGE